MNFIRSLNKYNLQIIITTVIFRDKLREKWYFFFVDMNDNIYNNYIYALNNEWWPGRADKSTKYLNLFFQTSSSSLSCAGSATPANIKTTNLIEYFILENILLLFLWLLRGHWGPSPQHIPASIYPYPELMPFVLYSEFRWVLYGLIHLPLFRTTKWPFPIGPPVEDRFY